MSQSAAKQSASTSGSVSNIRIVVADDHPVVRFGVRNMLQNEPGFEVAGEAEDGDDAITQTLELEPDILLLDLAMPRLPGLEAMRAIMAKSPRVKIVLLTAPSPSSRSLKRCRSALAASCPRILSLATSASAASRNQRRLLDWRRARRQPPQSAAGAEAQAAAVPERKTYGLTPRELEVVSCIVEGCSNRDIAKQFTISEETVKRHLSNVFDKTGVSTRLELALFAIAHKLVEL